MLAAQADRQSVTTIEGLSGPDFPAVNRLGGLLLLMRQGFMVAAAAAIGALFIRFAPRGLPEPAPRIPGGTKLGRSV